MKKRSLLSKASKHCCIALTAMMMCSCSSKSDYRTIHNDTFWNTTDGSPINSQGGGIFKFLDPQTNSERYFWYGVHYAEADLYRDEPTKRHPKCSFKGVTLYVSDNLTDWESSDYALSYNDVKKWGFDADGWLGRMGVTYIEESQTYALFIQHGSLVMVCTSKSPRGPFAYHRHIDMTAYCGTSNTGDQTVFVDPDTNIGYLIYSKARGRNHGFVSRIGMTSPDSVGLVDCHRVFVGEGREGNCMFKYKGAYYMCASDLWGWDCSHAYYLKADNIYGPYEPVNNMQKFVNVERDFAHQTQTGFFYTLRNGQDETVIYCGDRWADFANNGAGYNQWVPLSFDEENNPIFNSLSSWELDHKSGKWRVGKDNNYVLNGNFDADRRIIPEPVKPRQAFLTGWDTEFICGNVVAHEDTLSPQLNCHNNVNEQRRGANALFKMSLNISDKYSSFKRRVSQRVVSTPTIPVGKGRYTFKAKMCGEGDTLNVKMFVSTSVDLPDSHHVASLDVDNGVIHRTSGSTMPYDIAETNVDISETWQEFSLDFSCDEAPFRIGFEVTGGKGAWVHVDNVSLTKAE